MGFLKEKWTEGEVLNLPEGEHNFFDRKAGKLFADKGRLYATLSKALSAFANSGGGHIVLGQEDDGAIDGIPATEGRTPIREWLEQKLPTLVSYPLESFRVHRTVREAPSQIPADKELIVVDVGESRLAPHQASFPSDNPHYFYRQGGKSMPAPHHYLEALRNRLTVAVLEAQLVSVEPLKDLKAANGPLVELAFRFRIRNVSRVACYKWSLDCSLQYIGEWEPGLFVNRDEFPALSSGSSGISLDDTILPTRSRETTVVFGFRPPTKGPLDWVVRERLLPLQVHYYPISENHLGETQVTTVGEVVNVSQFEQAVESLLAGALR